MYQIILKTLSTASTKTTFLVHGQEIVGGSVSELAPLKIGDFDDLFPGVTNRGGFAALVIPGAFPSRETITQFVHQTGAFPKDCAVQII